jgi:hypothetical protein
MDAAIRRLGALSGLALLLSLSGCMEGATPEMAEWHGPSFSAEIVDLRDTTHPPARIYLGDGKMRFDSPDTSDEASFIFDPANKAMLVLLNTHRAYVDAGVLTRFVTPLFAPLIHFFRPASASDPCVDWNSTVSQLQFNSFLRHSGGGPLSARGTHFDCRHLGSDTVAGRPAEKWSVIESGAGHQYSYTYSSSDTARRSLKRVDTGTTTVWIDDRLQIVSKSTDDDDQWEMRHIHEGPQPVTLFVAPAGYRKLSFREIIGEIKKADSASDH